MRNTQEGQPYYFASHLCVFSWSHTSFLADAFCLRTTRASHLRGPMIRWHDLDMARETVDGRTISKGGQASNHSRRAETPRMLCEDRLVRPPQSGRGTRAAIQAAYAWPKQRTPDAIQCDTGMMTASRRRRYESCQRGVISSR
jgi:hypothetical protein